MSRFASFDTENIQAYQNQEPLKDLDILKNEVDTDDRKRNGRYKKRKIDTSALIAAGIVVLAIAVFIILKQI